MRLKSHVASINKRILPSGKPQWRVSYADANGQRKRPGFPSWTAADEFRKKVEAELSQGIHRPDARKMTVAETCEAFLAYCDGRMKRNERMTRKTLKNYRGHVENHIKPQIGGHKLAQLPPSAVNEFRDAIRDDGVGVVTTRKILATLSAVLNYAKGKDWVGANSADGIKVIGHRNEGAKKMRPPSKIDLKAVFTMADADLRLKIMFAAFTGLRASEQWALKWRNLDLSTGAVVVEERIDGYGEEGGTKSAAGDREVPLSDLLVREIRKHRLASKFVKDDDYVFANAKGRHISHDNLMKRHYKPLLNEANISGVNWHSLRHFAISTWIEQGLQPKTVQTYAGHSSLLVTMDRYGHLFPSEDHKTAMDAIAGELLG